MYIRGKANCIQWHPTKNGDLQLNDFSAGSHYKSWWICENKHEWQTSIRRIIGEKTGCPYCSGYRVIAGKTDLISIYPEKAKRWHSYLNHPLTPSDVTAHSSRKVWWVGSCGHEWKSPIATFRNDEYCPICSGQVTKAGFNDLGTTDPDIALTWNPRNAQLFTNFVRSSNKKVWWICEKKHEWEAVISARTRGNKCPVCSNKIVMKGYNDLATTHPELSDQWHLILNASLSPTEISAGSGKKVWWQCHLNHEWKALVYNRSIHGHQCPYCKNVKALPGFNDIATLHPLIAAQWHPSLNGDKKPKHYTSGSNQKVWWICKAGHEWEAKPNSRVNQYKTGCKECFYNTTSSIAESEVINFIKQYKFLPITDRTILKFGNMPEQFTQELDMYLSDYKTAFEFNGVYWHSDQFKSAKAQTRHYSKWRKTKEQNIRLFQIWEDDWASQTRQMLVKEAIARYLKFTDELAKDNSFKNSLERVNVARLLSPESNISRNHVSNFFNHNHLDGFSDAATDFIVLTDPNAGRGFGPRHLRAILAYKKDADGNLEILRFATYGQIDGAFARLLHRLETQERQSQITVALTNDMDAEDIYIAEGFGFSHALPPEFKWVVRDKRIPSTEIPTKPDTPKIWDSGRSVYKKVHKLVTPGSSNTVP